MYERIDYSKSIMTYVNFSELQQKGASRLKCNKDVTGREVDEEMLGTIPSIYNDCQNK